MPPKTIFGDREKKPVEESVKPTQPIQSILFSGYLVNRTEVSQSRREPVTIFGKSATVRKRIQIDRSDLKKKYPNADDATLDKAIESIIVTNCEQLSQSQIINWGQSTQEKFLDLLENLAEISNSSLLAATKNLINEIAALLESDVKTSGFLKKLLKKDNAQEIYAKIVIKNELLKKNTTMLHDMLTRIKQHLQESKELEADILINVIVATYIVDHISDEHKGLLIGRITSLESLFVQFKLSKKQFELLNDTIVNIISIIQDTLMVEVPAWYNNRNFEQVKNKENILKKLKI